MKLAGPLALAILASQASSLALADPTQPIPGFGLPVFSFERGDGSPIFEDVNGDGRLDAITFQAERVLVRLNVGSGAFGAPIESRASGKVTGLLVRDVNGDGWPDLFVYLADPGAGETAPVLLGDGSGRFRSDDGARFPTAGATLLEAGDVDGDARIDLVLLEDDRVAVLLGGQAGLFVESSSFGVRTDLQAASVSRAVLVDLDGEGRNDLVLVSWRPFATEYTSLVHVARGHGDGTFDPPVLQSSYLGWVWLDIADLNADGRPDLVVLNDMGGIRGDSLVVYLQSPDHGFQKVESTYLGSGAVAGIADIRLVGHPEILLNGPQKPSVAAYVDVDGDGRPDMIEADAVRLYVRLNVFGAFSGPPVRLVAPLVLPSGSASRPGFSSELSFVSLDTASRFQLAYRPRGSSVDFGFSSYLAPGEQRSQPGSWLVTDQPPAANVGVLRATASTAGHEPPRGAVLVRITTQTGEGDSRKTFGVSFPAVPDSDAFDAASTIAWLKEDGQDRTNIALLHAGEDGDGPITLRVTVTSTDREHPGSAMLPDVELGPAGFFQFDRALGRSGLGARSGWARVDRIRGAARYLAYAAINDNGTSDGSIVPAMAEGSGAGVRRLVLPVLVQNSRYASELVVTNVTRDERKRLQAEFIPSSHGAALGRVSFPLDLGPGEQLYWPDAVASLRALGAQGLPPEGTAVAGALFVSFEEGDARGLFVGSRTSTGDAAGHYGVFMGAVAGDDLATEKAVVYGLRQDRGSRSNLALVNAGDSRATYRVELLGPRGTEVLGVIDPVPADPGGWVQLDGVLQPYRGLAEITDGYARITRTSGDGPFYAYGVVNDGAAPGRGSGDGSVAPMLPVTSLP